MRKFDPKVQHLKYKVLREVARVAWQDQLLEKMPDIPKIIVPTDTATMRCCVYKERAIVTERIKLALGGDQSNPNVIEVIDIACDECPIGGIFVTPACRGCLVHRCKEVCPKDAIQIIDHKAVVDKSKCIECGKCTQACPYGAIIAQKRPCVNSCKVKAITVGEDKKAVIDNGKCISCGACVYQCPFGAIVDKSLIMDCIDILKKSENNTKYHVYAVIAPSIVSQFKYAKIEQVVTGMRKLGFHQVVEEGLVGDLFDAGCTWFPPSAGSNQAINMGAMTENEAMISTQARNFPGRNGSPKAIMYLASASTVAASAIEGCIADPRPYLEGVR